MDVWNTIISENAGNVPHTIHASVHDVNGRANGLHPTFLITVSLLSVLQVEVFISGTCYDCVP